MIVHFIKFQLLLNFRNAIPIFFSLILPPLMFLVFGKIFEFGSASEFTYAIYLLPGMIGVLATSEGLLSVGPTIKQYYEQGIILTFSSYPVWTGVLFFSLMLSKLIVMTIAILLLILVSYLFFNYVPEYINLAYYFGGAIFCFFLHALFAVNVCLSLMKRSLDSTILNLMYFVGMLLSGAFFTLDHIRALEILGYLFPLKSILQVMRNETDLSWVLILLIFAWVFFAVGWFMVMTRSNVVKRLSNLRA